MCHTPVPATTCCKRARRAVNRCETIDHETKHSRPTNLGETSDYSIISLASSRATELVERVSRWLHVDDALLKKTALVSIFRTRSCCILQSSIKSSKRSDILASQSIWELLRPPHLA